MRGTLLFDYNTDGHISGIFSSNYFVISIYLDKCHSPFYEP